LRRKELKAVLFTYLYSTFVKSINKSLIAYIKEGSGFNVRLNVNAIYAAAIFAL